MAKKLNESSQETIDKNFLEENPDIATEERPVIVATEIPKTEKIVFLNYRDPGVMLHFHYHSKTHPLKHYDLMHGQQYELPVEVINHLEGQRATDPWACHSRTYSRRMRSDGVTETFASGYVPYFQCKAVRA